VVGVAPDGFTGTTALFSAELWMPLASLERLRQSREERQVRLQDPRNYSLMLFGRMQEGVSATEVTGELAALARRSDANLPQRDGSTFSYMTAPMARLAIANQPETDGPLVGYSVFLVALSAVVLLIACVNLANMFLARGMERRTEMAIRQSLGSGRLRLIRQMLIEGLLLAFAGGA